jgi:hypothetical protein
MAKRNPEAVPFGGKPGDSHKKEPATITGEPVDGKVQLGLELHRIRRQVDDAKVALDHASRLIQEALKELR